MGFKDLKIHNKVLQAKQSWRILKEPNSLLHKLLQAKYFPNSSFMKVKFGHAPYSWKGVWESRKILEEGCRWSLGDDASIREQHNRMGERPR